VLGLRFCFVLLGLGRGRRVVGREEMGMGREIVGGWWKMPEFSFSFVSSVHNVI
jgi:hypothetical protein